MKGLPSGRIAALVPEFAVKDLPLGKTLMMIHSRELKCLQVIYENVDCVLTPGFFVHRFKGLRNSIPLVLCNLCLSVCLSNLLPKPPPLLYHPSISLLCPYLHIAHVINMNYVT